MRLKRGGLPNLTLREYRKLPYKTVTVLLEAIKDLNIEKDIELKRGFDVYFQAHLKYLGFKEVTLDHFNPSSRQKEVKALLSEGLTVESLQVYKEVEGILPPWVLIFEVHKLCELLLTDKHQ